MRANLIAVLRCAKCKSLMEPSSTMYCEKCFNDLADATREAIKLIDEAIDVIEDYSDTKLKYKAVKKLLEARFMLDELLS